MQELNDIVIIGATNRPDILDSALLRPGRFDRIVLVGPPDADSRKNIFTIHTKNMPLAPDFDMDALVTKTEGYVGADIESVCREAAMLALRDDPEVTHVSQAYFLTGIAKVGPSASKDIEDMYAEMEKTFRQARANEMKDSKPSYYG